MATYGGTSSPADLGEDPESSWLGMAFTPFGRRGSGKTGKGPRDYQRSDASIYDEIGTRLTEHPQIDATEVEVSVESGVVTLKGCVDERSIKYQIEDLVERVNGVKDIHNLIKVEKKGAISELSYSAKHGITAIF